MRHWIWALVLGLAGLSTLEGAEPRSLFNGKDLTGWEGKKELWSVEDGAITGKTDGKIPYNTFLIWKDGTVKDFELRFEYRLRGGNSGVQYRSKHLKEAGDFVVGGPQADMDSTNRYTGILYEERGRGIMAERGQKIVVDPQGDRFVVGELGDAAELGKAIKPDGWNDYLIVARGNTITHAINGKTLIELIDLQTDKRPVEGIIALQLHRGDPMTVQFKNFQLKTLEGGKILGPDEVKIPADARRLGSPRPNRAAPKGAPVPPPPA